MLYYLFEYLDKNFDIPGTGLFQFISFRSALAIIFSLFIAIVFGKKIINYLRRKQIGETVRDLGLEGQNEKAGTPTMGGLIIILATLIPVFLFAKLENIYVILLIFTTIWMGMIGFIDDYIKVFKKNKQGLPGKFKVVGQVVLGIAIGSIMYLHPDITVKLDETQVAKTHEIVQLTEQQIANKEAKALVTTIPCMKNNEFDYSQLVGWMGTNASKYAWLLFIPIVI